MIASIAQFRLVSYVITFCRQDFSRFLPAALLKQTSSRRGKEREFQLHVEDNNFRQLNFTFAVIALAAKLSRVGGRVTREEFLAFCDVFSMSAMQHEKIYKLFMMAAKEQTDAGHYARRIARLFPDRPELLQDLVERLGRFSNAGGRVGQAKRQLLENIAERLGVSKDAIRASLPPQFPLSADDPYKVLGASRKMSNNEIKRVYRERIRKYHPDRLIAGGYAISEVVAADGALAAINEAYNTIARKRKMK